MTFTKEQLYIVHFCAIECKLQISGEESVACMVRAWDWAMQQEGRPITSDDIRILGALIEPVKNLRGFREVGVRVGWDVKMDWRLVPEQVAKLVEAQDALAPRDWFREYEEVHPFVDGNGRSGACLFNWLAGTLTHPDWPPNFWKDSRRVPGFGAPRE